MSNARSVALRGGRPDARSAVLVLHGGREHSHSPTSPWQLSYVRMFDFYHGLRRAAPECAVYVLRYRFRGWNAGSGPRGRSEPDPVSDARWALDRISADVPGVPIALLGHSMGGRTAFAIADAPGVVGICALAPWLPEGEPVPGYRPEQRFVIAHGTADRMTSATLSRTYATRLRAQGAAVARFELAGARHALLDRSSLWREFAVATALGLVGERAVPAGVAAALRQTKDAGLAVDLAAYAAPPDASSHPSLTG